MPRLKNVRHERFAMLVAEGKSAPAAYREAELDKREGRKLTTKTINKSGYELAKRADVRIRILELRDELAKRLKVTTDTIIAELDDARMCARSFGQAAPMVAASLGKAKLCGLLIDRVQHSGGVVARVELDLSKLSTDELRQMRALVNRVTLTTETVAAADEGKPAVAAAAGNGTNGTAHGQASGPAGPVPPGSNGVHP